MTYVVQVWNPRRRAWDIVHSCNMADDAIRAGQAASHACDNARVIAVPTEQEILAALDELVADGTLRPRVCVAKHEFTYVLREREDQR